MPTVTHEWMDRALLKAMREDFGSKGLTDRYQYRIQDWQRYFGALACTDRAGVVNTPTIFQWLLSNKINLIAELLEVGIEGPTELPGRAIEYIRRGKAAPSAEVELERRQSDALALEEVLIAEGLSPTRARTIANQSFTLEAVSPWTATQVRRLIEQRGGPTDGVLQELESQGVPLHIIREAVRLSEIEPLPPKTLTIHGRTFTATTQPPLDVVWRELNYLAATIAGEQDRRIPNAGDWARARAALAAKYPAPTTAPRGPIVGPMKFPRRF